LRRKTSKTEINFNLNNSKIISNKKSMTDISVISDYSTTKSKITNIEVLFKNNSNFNNSTYTNRRNTNNINIRNNTNENNTFKYTGYYRKYKNKK
jgi:hypothetical protein